MTLNDYSDVFLVLFVILDDQEGPDLLEIRSNMAKKRAKYAKIKVFDPLVKIGVLISPGTHFK